MDLGVNNGHVGLPPGQLLLPLAGRTATPIRVLDLFAGAGGLSFGFERLVADCGCKVFTLAAAVEKDSHACETLRANHATHDGEVSAAIIEGDLTDPSVHQHVLDSLGDFPVDVVVGGPPCQSYSQIGTRTGRWVGEERFKKDQRDLLFEEYIRLVRELLPRCIVLENVDGIRSKKSAGGRAYLDVIIEQLESEGYTFAVAGSRRKFVRLNAADYGVPQVRNRVFLVGNRLGVPFAPPASTHYDPDLADGRRPPGARYPWVDLQAAIGDLPAVRAHFTRTHLSDDEWGEKREANLTRDNGEEERPYHTAALARHYERMPEAGRSFLDFVRPCKQGAKLRYHRARDQQASDIELFGLMPQGATAEDIFERDPALVELQRLIRYDMQSFKDKYRKQAWHYPSTTIFAHLERDGNRFIHPDSWQARTITVREAARVQSFPDDYVFFGGLKSRFRQIGNAVPPLVSLALAKAIYATLVSAGNVVHCCGPASNAPQRVSEACHAAS